MHLFPNITFPEISISEYKLDNGLKILFIEDHSLPLITYCTFYRVGTRNERKGITGISHFLEHMMFNGTKKYGPKIFDMLIESNGGYSNACTSTDITVYYEEFPKDILNLIIDLESDRMTNLIFEPSIVESERRVILEERSSSIDNYPPGKLEEELFSLAYDNHPYSWPVIGLREDIKSISRDELLNYYRSFYCPNNALIVISGDIYPNEALSVIKKFYDSILPNKFNENPLKLPSIRKEKRKEIKYKVEIPSFMSAYLCPSIKNKDIFVLDLIETILAYGKSSRLYQKLIEEKPMAIKISVDFSWRFEPSLFTFYVQMGTGYSNYDGEEIIYEEIDKIKKESVSIEEINKAKNIHIVDFLRSFKKNISRANLIGQFEILFGDWRKIYSLIDEYKKITRDDIVEVINKYFYDNNRIVVHMIPEN
ncbi:insulinase family protein [Candidatus Aminicenantes bacterium AC-335-B20]|jgi:predicted Zn-dependent peptidase|nr:insulinase family protein [SCandidatus Aminicenantes bacterium Aminicenantia_JdfR_composite]MCP2599117.1 insulinase family protein [Candidatus Aminicenantes bacterium AC-335-B20]